MSSMEDLENGQWVGGLDLACVEPDGAISLVVGWMSAGKLKLCTVATSEEVANEFGAVVEDVVNDLSNREAERWSPEAVVTAETYLTLSVDELGSVPTLARSVDSFGSFVEALKSAASLPNLDARDLPAAEMSLYAFVIGDDPDSRAVFVRKANPRRSLRRGRMIMALHDTLVRIDEPLFGFEEGIDIVVVGDVVGIISPTAFAAIFRNNEALEALIPQWIGEIEKTLTFSDEGRSFILSKAKRDSRIRSRLDSIVARGHLSNVTPTTLRQAIVEAQLEPTDYLSDDDDLLVTAENVYELMHVLNEDLYEGSLSSARFRVDRKQVR